MTLESRIAISVFAAGVLLAIVALAGCGEEPSEMSKICQDEGTQEQDYSAQGPGPKHGTVRMTYANSSPIGPCAATLDGSRLALRVLDPEVSISDLRIHCAEVDLEDAALDSLEDGISGKGQFDADQGALEDALEGECTRVPIID